MYKMKGVNVIKEGKYASFIFTFFNPNSKQHGCACKKYM